MRNCNGLLFALCLISLMIVNLYGQDQGQLKLFIREKGQEAIIEACYCNLSDDSLYLVNIKGYQKLTPKGYQMGFIVESNDSVINPIYKTRITYKSNALTGLKGSEKYCIDFNLQDLFASVPTDFSVAIYYQNHQAFLNGKKIWVGYVRSNRIRIRL